MSHPHLGFRDAQPQALIFVTVSDQPTYAMALAGTKTGDRGAVGGAGLHFIHKGWLTEKPVAFFCLVCAHLALSFARVAGERIKPRVRTRGRDQLTWPSRRRRRQPFMYHFGISAVARYRGLGCLLLHLTTGSLPGVAKRGSCRSLRELKS